MKTLTLLALLLLAAPTPPETGYLVSIAYTGTHETKIIKTCDCQHVAAVFERNTGLTVDPEKVFTPTNNFFEYRTQNIHFYCERKRIVTRKGKKVFKRVK